MKKRKSEDAHTPKQDHSDNTKVAGRRRLLTALGLGGSTAFLPPLWHKPVVQGLILPAHAQTSSPVLFDPCSVSLVFEAGQVGIGGCTGGQFTSVIPIVSGSVVGQGSLSGIDIDIESVLTGGNLPDQTVNVSTTTDGSGNYQVTIDGFQTSDGPHIVCTQDCDTNFPMGGTVAVTVTSSDPRLPGTTNCSDSFDCEDISNPMGSLGEQDDDRAPNRFYVEMTPVDQTGRKS